MKINLIARTNGVGLDRDVDLVHQCLSASGHDVSISHCRAISPVRSIFPAKKKYDINIFMERVFPRWLSTADKNWLIPNQERFPHRHLHHLKKIDLILCKSRHAEEIFSAHGKTQFIGFTSTDMADDSVSPDYQTFLHLAGRSTLKGTDTILKLWEKHPDWPTLTLIQCKENAPQEIPANVKLISDYVPHGDIIKHLNAHGIHLCPSLSEGWGHYIVEAMSCRAVVVTTNAPPMNEIVSPQRGVLAPSNKNEPRHLGTNFYVDEEKLELLIGQLLRMPPEDKQRFGESARLWFTENHQSFTTNLQQLVAGANHE